VRDRQPERQLVAAVLLDTIELLRKTRDATDERARRRRAAVEAWFAATDRGWPFSFVSICAALDLDPDVVRAALR
jgi:hypothetical protein